MNKNLSIYLDALRLTAAVGVLLGHSSRYFMPQLGWVLGGHALASVATFFVLSGFVIRFVTREKELDGYSYAVARFSRLYSVVPLAILVTIGADLVGTAHAPEIYAGKSYYNPEWGGRELLSYFTLTNEVWFTHQVLGSNEPFWSLGFEASYYLLFGCVTFFTGRAKAIVTVLAALVMGPKLLLFFALWYLGVITYDLVTAERTSTLRRRTGGAIFLVSIVAYPIFVKMFGAGTINAYHSDSVGQMLTSFAWFFGVGLIASANLVGFAILSRGATLWPDRISKAIQWAAGASFTLYLVHQPLILCGLALMPAAKVSLAVGGALIALVVCTVLILAELGERRKRPYRAAFQYILLPFARQ
ncbi:acyltransferase family protein [Novosphingobium fluoreni]|uniref:acyltransferase family protein n=1 Tax=Novosphingobium fluoreni TaxID=1391222 RepID=UPI003DA140AB